MSAYDGITFNIKSGSGTAPPIWVEFQNTENVPTPDGTAKYSGVDQYNTRGMLLTNVGTSWTKVSVPFAILAPRYLPNLTENRLFERQRRLRGSAVGLEEHPRVPVRRLPAIHRPALHVQHQPELRHLGR